MLSFDRQGKGAPLVLLHGTNCSRHIWDPILPQLSARRDVIAVDLPAHGDSAPSSFTPPEFAREVAALFDSLGLEAPPVVGHSVGGWTALEVAKLGRAGAVLALAPAGLWREHSPFLTDLGLKVNWRLGQIMGAAAELPLRTRLGRRLALRSIAANPAGVPYEVALQTARTAAASKHFPRHVAQTRVLRFEGGDAISAQVPVRVVWGDSDHVALARRSRFSDELPAHAKIETWRNCGHMVMWDREAETIEAALETAPAAITSWSGSAAPLAPSRDARPR